MTVDWDAHEAAFLAALQRRGAINEEPPVSADETEGLRSFEQDRANTIHDLLVDEVDRLRVRLEAIEEVAVCPVNEWETDERRLEMILRLARGDNRHAETPPEPDENGS